MPLALSYRVLPIGASLTLAATMAYSLQAADPIPLFAGNITNSFQLNGLDKANWRTVIVTGRPFSEAWNLKTPWPAQVAPWDFRLIGKPATRIQRGDRLVATLWMRTISAAYGEGYTRFVLERNRPPYPKSAEFALSAGAEWRQFQLPFVAAETDEADGYTAQLWISSGPQEIEIGGFQIKNYGPGVGFDELGLKDYPYPGSATDAPWRAQAAARIDKHRRGDLVVVVRDEEGNPVPEAAVRIRMKSHAFRFGAAVDGSLLTESSANAEKYRQTLRDNFRQATLENDLKWTEWMRNRGRALEALEWLKQNGIGPVRGHTLIWPGWEYLPSDLKNLADNPEQLRARIDQHFRDIIPAVRGRVDKWDVINEPITNTALQNILGEAELARWFQLARSHDPSAKLFINDFNILEAGGNDTPHQAALAQLVANLERRGAGIDGIGLQAHFGADLTPPDKLYALIDRFAAFGKDLEITEFDAAIADEKLQAAYMRDFLTLAYSHPSISGITLWGFWEGRHWQPDAALFRRDFSIKPSGQVWRDLLFKEWWTDATGVTGADGVYRLRANAGTFEAEVDIRGKKETFQFSVEAGKPNYLFLGKRIAPQVRSAGIVNAASYANGPVAPGEIVTIFGDNFGYAAPASGSGELSSVVGDVRVLIDGAAVPIISAARNQASAIVPKTGAGLARFQVEFQGITSGVATLPVAEAAPGVFTLNGGTGQAAAQNNDSAQSTNTAGTPVARGGILSFYVTGCATPSEDAPAITATIGGTPGAVEFAGRIFPGVVQVNARIPANAPTGAEVPLRVSCAGFPAQQGVTIAVQ